MENTTGHIWADRLNKSIEQPPIKQARTTSTIRLTDVLILAMPVVGALTGVAVVLLGKVMAS